MLHSLLLPCSCLLLLRSCLLLLLLSLLLLLQVSFPIADASAAAAGEALVGSHLVAWTTTPWTLPSNLALCVHPEFDYVQVRTGLLC
jgi:hypothetical protein